MDVTVVLKRFGTPDEVRELTLGRATYQPGWRWSGRRSGPSGARSSSHISLVWWKADATEGDDGAARLDNRRQHRFNPDLLRDFWDDRSRAAGREL